MKTILESIILNIVDDKEAVSIEELHKEMLMLKKMYEQDMNKCKKEIEELIHNTYENYYAVIKIDKLYAGKENRG